MITFRVLSSICASSLLLAGCGGGGGSGSSSSSSSSSGSSSSSSSSSGGTGQGSIPFQNVAVHDPSVIRVGGEYYVFGSHLAAAKTTDLMNWTLVADGVNNANPLYTNVLTALQDTFTWSQVNDLWAADVARLGDGKYYFYYNSCRGDSPRSALGVAVADSVNGPYVNKQIFLRSGMPGLSEDGATVYDAQVHPNVVDPQTFFDANGNLWMVYGSYSGGIFILAMNETTGLPDPGQGYGKHLMGGNHARIEGPYIIRNAQTGYYYLFTSFGGLDSAGTYNIRVARAQLPDGPYFDAAGTDMATVKGSPTQIFFDPSIEPHGQKLMGSHQFGIMPGESGAQLGYVSPGHNSAYFDAASGNYYLFFHTRFPGRGEQHEVRVHQMFFNSEGWPVVAPLRYVPLAMANPAQATDVPNADVAGSYKMVNHGKDISTSTKPSTAAGLAPGGALTGSGVTLGQWLHRGNNLIDITINGTIYYGVLSRQWNPNMNTFVVTFSAQARDGVSIWGVRTGS